MYPTPETTVNVFGLPLDYVVEGFTPLNDAQAMLDSISDLALLSADELMYAYAEADEEGDVLLCAEIDAEMRCRNFRSAEVFCPSVLSSEGALGLFVLV